MPAAAPPTTRRTTSRVSQKRTRLRPGVIIQGPVSSEGQAGLRPAEPGAKGGCSQNLAALTVAGLAPNESAHLNKTHFLAGPAADGSRTTAAERSGSR